MIVVIVLVAATAVLTRTISATASTADSCNETTFCTSATSSLVLVGVKMARGEKRRRQGLGLVTGLEYI